MDLDADGLPVDEVGEWAEEKHERLRKYIDASRAARRKFVDGTGGATYIDLFCGYGRSRLRNTGVAVDGSPLVAFRSSVASGVPYTQFYIADSEKEKCEAAAARLIKLGGSPSVHVGSAQQTAQAIVPKLNPYGLHFAFLDPYNLEALPFSVIEALATLKRIDLLIHVSAQDLQRNLHLYLDPADTRLERFAPGWRDEVDVGQSQPAVRAAILAHWARQMERLGLPPAKHAELVTGSINQRLYWLIFASRSDFAVKLWNEIRSVSGQRSLL